MLTNEFAANRSIINSDASNRQKFINSTNIVLSNATLSSNTENLDVTQHSKMDIFKPNLISEFNINVLATPTKIKFNKKDSITKCSINSEFSRLHKNKAQVFDNIENNYDIINVNVPNSVNQNLTNCKFKHNLPSSQENKMNHSLYSQENISHISKLKTTPLTVDISIKKYDINSKIASPGCIPINESMYTHVPFNNSTVYMKPYSTCSTLNGSLPSDHLIYQSPMHKITYQSNIYINQQSSHTPFNQSNNDQCLNCVNLNSQIKHSNNSDKAFDSYGSFKDNFDITQFGKETLLKLNSTKPIINSSNELYRDLNLEIEPIKHNSIINSDNSYNTTSFISPRKISSNVNTFNIISPQNINTVNEKSDTLDLSSQQFNFTNGSTINLQSRVLKDQIISSGNESHISINSIISPQHFSFAKLLPISEGIISLQQNNFQKEFELKNESNVNSPLHISKNKNPNENCNIFPQQKNICNEYKSSNSNSITHVSSPRHFSLFKTAASTGNKNTVLSPEQIIINEDKIILNNTKGFSSPQHFSSNKYGNDHAISSTHIFNDDFSPFCGNNKPLQQFSLNKDTIGQFPSGGGARKKPTFILPPSKTDKENRESEEIDKKYEEIMKLSGKLLIAGKRTLVDINEMESISELGHGTCGYVIEMLHKPSNTTMAVKQMRRSGSYEENKRIIMDLDVVMKCHSCPNIVQCFGTFITQTDVWICMELMSTCLDKLIKAYRKPIPERILGKIAVSTVDALNYLKENHEVIHRDVKPSNILLDDGGRIKLCDFGISGRLVDSKAKTRSAGCTAYMAPERIDPPDPSQPDYDIRADVWSLGLTLVELATCQFPYKNCETDFELLSKILMEPAPRLPSNSGFSMDFGAFVSQCLTKDYIRRPKYQELFKHNFILRYRSLYVDVQSWYSQVKVSIQQEQCK